eukprot:Pgem_evm1s16656
MHKIPMFTNNCDMVPPDVELVCERKCISIEKEETVDPPTKKKRKSIKAAV